MNWSSRITAAGVAGALVFSSALGCGPSDPAEENDNEDELVAPSIDSFEADPDTITSGVDVDAQEIQGDVELSWETEDSAETTLLAGDTQLNVNDCQPLDDNCDAGGTLTDDPDADTTYRLNTVGDEDAECDIEDGEVLNPELCSSETVDVEVRQPATISLEREGDRFEAGEEFTVDYEVEGADEFELGLADGTNLYETCEIDDDDAVCSRPDEDSGELTIRDQDEPLTISGSATNGADDGLGDVEVGDVQLELYPEGAPVITSFEADPAHVDYDGTTTLSWETEDTEEIEISSDFEGYLETDLSEACTDAEGSCDVQFTDQQVDGSEVTFSAVATSEDGEESQASETGVIFALAPVIDSFEADPAEISGDSTDIELSWDNANWPTRLMLEDDDGDVILDTDDDTGTDKCETDGCNFGSDTLTVEDLDANTQFTLTATSPLGTDISSVQVVHADGPQIESIEVDAQDVLEAPAVVDTDEANLEWATNDNTDDTELDRGEVPEDGCDSDDVDFDQVTDFSGDADGDYTLGDLEQTEECFQLTAFTDGGDQTATATFKVARSPEVHDFDGNPDTVGRGNDVTLSWETSFVSDVDVDADNLGAVDSDDLDDCSELDTDGNGSCEVGISDGTSADSVEFTIEATGFDDMTDSASSETFIGDAPTVTTFCAQTESADNCESTTTADTDSEDVTLEWELEESNADELTITDGDGNVVDEQDDDIGVSGEVTVDDVDTTTTWTLDVTNDFGAESADATAFFGPVITQFDVNGEDGLDGEAIVDTGDVDFEWTITDAEPETTQLDRSDVPAGDDTCADVDSGDWESLVDDGDADSSYTDGEVTENGCYRLMAEDDGGLTSSVTVEVTEVPFVVDLETSEDSVDGNDADDVTVSVDVVGPTEFDLVAVYYEEDDDGDDTNLGSDDVCDEDSATGGSSLDGSADEHDVHCDHSMENPDVGGCGGTLQPDCEPREGTDYIRYEFNFSDDEGDGAVIDSGTFDQDVDVDWNDD